MVVDRHSSLIPESFGFGGRAPSYKSRRSVQYTRLCFSVFFCVSFHGSMIRSYSGSTSRIVGLFFLTMVLLWFKWLLELEKNMYKRGKRLYITLVFQLFKYFFCKR